MKRINFLLLTLLGLFSSLSVFAYDFSLDGIYYNYGDKKSCLVVVSGDNRYAGDVKIPATVTYEGVTYPVSALGYEAFSDCRDLTSVDAPSIINVGYRAFYGCSRLIAVHLGQLISMTQQAFCYCSRLESLNVDFSKLKEIPYLAFNGCSSLTRFDFGTISSIGGGAFSNCSGLKDIDFGMVKSIGGGAFSECSNLTSLDLKLVEHVNENAFEGCQSLTSVTMENVKTIGYRSFNGLSSLKTIKLGAIESFAESSFDGCTRLQNFDLSRAQLKEIPYLAFRGCSSLTRFDFSNISSIGGGAFSNCSGLKDIDFGMVQSIGGYAFQNCIGLSDLKMSNVKYINDWAFAGCANLLSIDLGPVNKIDYKAFSSCNGLKIVKVSASYPATLHNEGFSTAAYNNATLVVPNTAIPAYNKAEGWKLFKKVIDESQYLGDVYLSISSNDGGVVSLDGTSVNNETFKTKVVQGEKVTLSIVANQGYRLKSVSVDQKDVTNEVKDNEYSFVVEYNTDVVVVFEPLPFTLTLQHAENGMIEQEVMKGSTLNFRFRATEGWKINTVSFNGEDVTSQLDENYNYTTPAITKNSIINISFEADNVSAVEVLSDSHISVRGYDGNILVEGVDRGEHVGVYSIGGSRIATAISSGKSLRFGVPESQTYIVKVGKRTFKLVL